MSTWTGSPSSTRTQSKSSQSHPHHPYPNPGSTYYEVVSQDELGCERVGVRWWKVLHGMHQRAPWMVSMVSKQCSTDNLYPFFIRVWGSEETLNEYKARIRIFSVRHQDTPGVQERSGQKKKQTNQREIENGRNIFWKSFDKKIFDFVQVLERSSYPAQCEQVVLHLLPWNWPILIYFPLGNDFIWNKFS